jgi:hypothetical protein
MQPSSTFQQRFHAWLAGNPDDQVLRWIFRTVIVVTVAVLGVDLANMSGLTDGVRDAVTPSQTQTSSPASPDTAPSMIPAILAPLMPGGGRLTPMPQPDAAMAKQMTFELVGGGKLMATGTITPGIFETFSAEVTKRGDYIKTVVLNSPGGSVGDALAMGKLIRDKKLATEVESGKYCASSCPLVFVGGVERKAGDKAAIGVHQVFAMPGDVSAVKDGMNEAQRVSARCQRYLGDMGVNLQMWVHAMETPKEKLFVFKPDELKSLNIVTAANAPVATTAPPPKPRS